MGSNEDKSMDMGFQNRGDNSGISTNSFFAPAWDPVASLGRHENFGVSQSEFTSSCPYPVVLENQAISSTSHFGHYPSDSSFAELVPKFPSFGSENFSDMVGSFGLTDCGPIANSRCPSSYIPNKQDGNRRVGKNGAQSLEDQQLSGEATVASSPNGQGRKRMADSNSPLDPSKKAEGEVQKDAGESFDLPKEQDQKKPRTEQNTGSNIKGKQIAKQAKDNSPNREAPKENYIHVRARRGQATNSHSLAERVRREKISERMRLLQELVPGCNKITGKAVMLDEIINYVQSLQQQVEFLSMKLATVNPELNIDLERLLSKDILHSRGGNAAIMGFTPGMNPHAYLHGIFQTGTSVIPNTNSQLPSMPQAVLENDFQSVFQMGFNSGPVIENLGPNGRLKPEL